MAMRYSVRHSAVQKASRSLAPMDEKETRRPPRSDIYGAMQQNAGRLHQSVNVACNVRGGFEFAHLSLIDILNVCIHSWMLMPRIHVKSPRRRRLSYTDQLSTNNKSIRWANIQRPDSGPRAAPIPDMCVFQPS